MAMDSGKLAEEIRDALGHADKPVSPQTKGMAKAIIAELSETGIVSHLLVLGTTAPGAPLSAGAAAGGILLGPSGATLAVRFVAEGVAPSPTPELLEMANGIALSLLTAQINFPTGTITGTCTNSPLSPGPLILGQGSGGKVAGLSGPSMASIAFASRGTTPETIKMCTAIANHIMQNAEASYLTGTVQGVCPPAGGPLVGFAAGGRLS